MEHLQILVVEDDARVSELICRALREQGWQTVAAFDGEQGAEKAEQQNFDLVILDIILPKIDGVSLCKRLREQQQQLPIIMLTALGTTDDKLEGFDAGADDYLVKPFDMLELLARVRALLKRGKAQSSSSQAETLFFADLSMDMRSKCVNRAGKNIELTPKEFALLRYMLENAERVLSRSEIAEQVWGLSFDTGTNFIDVYINYLRKKIDRHFEPKLIHTKTGMGFVLRINSER
jgi:DNA-binding response OmpR family regulator